jgi:hypothetical protein
MPTNNGCRCVGSCNIPKSWLTTMWFRERTGRELEPKATGWRLAGILTRNMPTSTRERCCDTHARGMCVCLFLREKRARGVLTA